VSKPNPFDERITKREQGKSTPPPPARTTKAGKKEPDPFIDDGELFPSKKAEKERRVKEESKGKEDKRTKKYKDSLFSVDYDDKRTKEKDEQRKRTAEEDKKDDVRLKDEEVNEVATKTVVEPKKQSKAKKSRPAKKEESVVSDEIIQESKEPEEPSALNQQSPRAPIEETQQMDVDNAPAVRASPSPARSEKLPFSAPADEEFTEISVGHR
jgi:hypothetical protein